MQYIPTNIKINLEWTVKKGIGNEAEDFGRSRVHLFLASDKDRWSVPCEAGSTGKVTAELPETLPEGVYHLELVWYKNENTIEALRAVQRTRKTCVFAIDSAISVQGSKATLRLETVASTYGYDGLSAYEIAVLRGKTTLSEEEWAKGLFDDVLANLLRANVDEVARAHAKIAMLEDEVERLWEALSNIGGDIPPVEIPLPTVGNALTYNRSQQTYTCGNWAVLSGRGVTVTGNTATQAGAYTAIYTLPEDTESASYRWEGDSSGKRDVEVAWSIAKKKAKITVNVPNKSIYKGDALTFSGSVDNGGEVKFYANATEVFSGNLYPETSFNLVARASGGDLSNYIAADDVTTYITVSEKAVSPTVGYISVENLEGLMEMLSYGDNFNLLEGGHFDLDEPDLGLPVSFEDFNSTSVTKEEITLLRNGKGIKDITGNTFRPLAESADLKIYQIAIGSTIEIIK
jgi:hypothetical protein